MKLLLKIYSKSPGRINFLNSQYLCMIKLVFGRSNSFVYVCNMFCVCMYITYNNWNNLLYRAYTYELYICTYYTKTIIKFKK